ncbi:hypothetical protein IAU59_005872 [Kwoniella sp. CBS 9459]
MPSVLSPTHPSAKSYAPLADEVNPPFGNIAPAPTVTRNGTIVYSKRIPSTTSTASSSADSDDLERVGAQLRNDSEETLSPSSSRKGKSRAMGERPLMEQPESDLGDIGEIPRSTHKGKERAWDLERGRESIVEEPEDMQSQGQYPPVNETEEEERRIQDNLARFAAKEAARRRAARESRQLPAASGPASPRSSSSTTSYSRRPFSMLSTSTTSKRNSIMGLVEGIWPGSPRKNDGWAEGELPTVHSPRAQDTPYANPYDPQPSFSPVPKMVISPTSPERPSPFADPAPPAPTAGSSSSHHRRPSLVSASSGGSAHSPINSPTETGGFSYGGPTWRGGQAAQVQDDDAQSRTGDKWWHALCAWGNDLDGGHAGNDRGNQAGRTNPFE